MRSVPDTPRVRTLEKCLEDLRCAVAEAEAAFWRALPNRRTAEVDAAELADMATDLYRVVDDMERWMSQHLAQRIPVKDAPATSTSGS